MSAYSSFATPGEPVKAIDYSYGSRTFLAPLTEPELPNEQNLFLNNHLRFEKQGNLVTVYFINDNGIPMFDSNTYDANILRILAYGFTYNIGTIPLDYAPADEAILYFLALFFDSDGILFDQVQLISFDIFQEEEPVVYFGRQLSLGSDTPLYKVLIIPIKNSYII